MKSPTIPCPRNCGYSDADPAHVAQHIADVHKPKGFSAFQIEWSLRAALARSAKPVKQRRLRAA